MGSRMRVFHWGVFLSGPPDSDPNLVWVGDSKRNGGYGRSTREADTHALNHTSESVDYESVTREIDYHDFGATAVQRMELPEDDESLVMLHPGNPKSELFVALTNEVHLKEIARGIASARGYKVRAIVTKKVLDLP